MAIYVKCKKGKERCGKSSGEIKMTTAVYTVLSVLCSTDTEVTAFLFSTHQKDNTFPISMRDIYNKAFYCSLLIRSKRCKFINIYLMYASTDTEIL